MGNAQREARRLNEPRGNGQIRALPWDRRSPDRRFGQPDSQRGDVNSEDKLIARIAGAVPSIRGDGGRRAGPLRLGIGDDAALLASRPGREWVLSCDQFLDGVHFHAETYPPDSVGYKSLVRATSDLAAMGAEPRYFLLALALPSARTGRG